MEMEKPKFREEDCGLSIFVFRAFLYLPPDYRMSMIRAPSRFFGMKAQQRTFNPLRTPGSYSKDRC